MIQIHSNLKKGELKLKPENKDDLWCLSQIIDTNDLVQAKSLRKIKTGSGDDRAAVVRKLVFLTLRVEKVELDDHLRILGTVEEGTDDVPKGSHHSFAIQEQDSLMIIKEKWLKFQLEKIKEAVSVKTSPVLLCVFDREECYLALMKRQGYEVIAHLEGNVQKKSVEGSGSGNFFDDILKKVEEIISRQRVDYIIMASPAFWKDEMMKRVKDDGLKKKIILATCSSVGESALTEILRRKEIQTALKDDRTTQETNLVEDLLTAIAKDEKVSYGMKEVKTAVDGGAVSMLLVTDGLIKKMREQKSYEKLEHLMKSVEQIKGEVHLISSIHEAGRKLDGLGGIGALLRYNLSY